MNHTHKFKKLIIIFLICILLKPSNSEAQSYTWPANGHTYNLVGWNTWFGAEGIGNLNGGHLVSINSAEEQAMLYDYFCNTIGLSEFWIGLSDYSVEGTWVWTSGEPTIYTNWRSGEPNNSWNAEHHALVVCSSDGQWNDFQHINEQNMLRPGVIEIPVSATVTASPTVTPSLTPTSTNTTTATFTSTPTFTNTATSTSTSTYTASFTHTSTPSYTPTQTLTSTATFTPTYTPTFTPTTTSTHTITVTSTNTSTLTSTRTNTATTTRTATSTPTPTTQCSYKLIGNAIVCL